MPPDKANGHQDITVADMMNEFFNQTINEITKWFQRRFRGECEAPSPWTISNRYSYGSQTLPSRVTGFSRFSGICCHVGDGDVTLVGG